MSDPAHTPGPWEAALEHGCHGVIASVAGKAVFVAVIINDTETPEKEPMRFANARVMAASTEMLEVLKRITREARLDGLDERAGWDCWLNMADEAIAKAEGSA